MPTALVTGISGQDGSYLADKLIAANYVVHGVSRRKRVLAQHPEWVDRVTVHTIDPSQAEAWSQLFSEIRPDEVYHLAADSFVPNSWSDPLANVHSNLGLTIQLLQSLLEYCPGSRFLNACSREIYGNTPVDQADELTPMCPITPYGVNKAASRWIGQCYRDKHNLFVANAVLFNHESPRRPVNFVTRKITRGAAEIHAGIRDKLELGNLSARRDWGYAGDFVDAMWRILQHDSPEDFVLGTGTTHSIAQLAELAFSAVNLDWQDHVVTSPSLQRTRDAAALAANPEKARHLLGWQPTTNFADLVSMMVENDIRLLQQQRRAA